MTSEGSHGSSVFLKVLASSSWFKKERQVSLSFLRWKRESKCWVFADFEMGYYKMESQN